MSVIKLQAEPLVPRIVATTPLPRGTDRPASNSCLKSRRLRPGRAGLREKLLRGLQQLAVLAVVPGLGVGHADALDDALPDPVGRVEVGRKLQREPRIMRVHHIVRLRPPSVTVDAHEMGKLLRHARESAGGRRADKAALALRNRPARGKTCVRANRL